VRSRLLRCITMYCTALYCTVLYCTVLHCTALHCTALYCTVLSTAPDMTAADRLRDIKKLQREAVKYKAPAEVQGRAQAKRRHCLTANYPHHTTQYSIGWCASMTAGKEKGRAAQGTHQGWNSRYPDPTHRFWQRFQPTCTIPPHPSH
jgi:hypothetical protein